MGGRPALDGMTVLERSSGLPGAYCGRLLAVLGADVVNVESSSRPDEARAAGTGGDRFLHAQKRSLALDVARPQAPPVLDLAADGELATAAGREAQRAHVDEQVAAWTRARDGRAIEALLQDAGIPAAVCARSSDLAADEQLWSRRFFRILERPEVGAHPFPGPIVGLTSTPAVIERPAPSYGQHTDEVLRDLLGLGDDEIAALFAAGVTSTEPLAQDWR